MTEKIDTREIAKRFVESGHNFYKAIPGLVDPIKNAVLSAFIDLKEIANEIPDKETFKDIVADYLDIIYVSNNPVVEMLDRPFFDKVLDLVDNLYSRVNPDWYDDLQKLFNKVSDKITIAQLDDILKEQENV